MLTDGIQTLTENLGKTGCYFFCLCSVAEEYLGRKVDVLEAANEAVKRGYCTKEFYIEYPGLILEMITHKKWEVRKDKYPFVNATDKEFVITRYERTTTMTTLAHFERENFHSIIDCYTSFYGKPVSTRICKVLN